MRRPRIRHLLLVVLAVACGACSSRPERIVLVTIDTLRADHVGCYGATRARTPVLDGLAAEGVRFETALSPVPLTLPTHASLLTALDPPRHGVRHNSLFRLGEGIPTLAERLHAEGFATAAFVGAVVLDPRFGLARGFETYDATPDPRRPGVTGYAERTADHVVDAALRWLAGAPDRFFLWVHLYDPHAPYAPPADLAREFPDAPYDGEIAFADREVGRLLGAIRARHGAGGTLVVVTSDHGESLGDHGELGHGYGLYDATQRVPLVLAGPGVPRARVIAQPVRSIDVAPTLLALAGAEPLPDVDGADLAPVVEGREPAPRRTYMETLATQLDYGWSPLYALRTDAWKLVHAPEPELYDLASDPAEIRNVAPAHPSEAAALRAEVEVAAARPALASEGVLLSASERARLESLGYVVSSPSGVGDEIGRVGGPDPKWERSLLPRVSQVLRLLAEDRIAEAHAALQRIPGGGPYVAALRARTAISAGDAAAALREADALAAMRGQQALAEEIRGQAHLLAGRLDDAASALDRALALDPASVSALQASGQVAEARADRAGAKERYARALALDPQAADVRWRLAALALEDGDDAGAAALLAPLDADALGRPPVAVRLAHAELAAGKGDAARRRLDAAARAHPGSLLVVQSRAYAFDRLGLPEEALAAREAVLRLAPDSPDALNDVAWSLAELGRDLDRALALAERAGAAAPDSFAVQDTIAAVRLRRGEPANALAVLDRALARGPGAEAAHLHYQRALALDALGRRKPAAEALARALDAPAEPPPAWWADARPLAARLGVPWPAAAGAGAGAAPPSEPRSGS